jgi:uncharacterized protein with HEPN domain
VEQEIALFEMMNSLNPDQRQKLIDAAKERAKKMIADTITTNLEAKGEAVQTIPTSSLQALSR